MSANRDMLIAALGGTPHIRKTYKHIPANQVDRILQTHPISGRYTDNLAALIQKLETKNASMKPKNNLAKLFAGMNMSGKKKPSPKKTMAMSGMLAALPVIRKKPTRMSKQTIVKKRPVMKRNSRYEALILEQLRKPQKVNLAKPMNVEKM